LHISQRALERTSPAEDIIHDDASVGVIVDCQAIFLGKLLPNAVEVIDEIDEGHWPIGMSKWHYCVGSFDGIHPLKCEPFLTIKGHQKLMVTHRHIEHPHPTPLDKLVEYCQITACYKQKA
jgi:hypothetical protein